MPLGKAKQVEWMREYRKRQIVSQVKRLYPDGRLPNCPDGRFRLDAGITL